MSRAEPPRPSLLLQSAPACLQYYSEQLLPLAESCRAAASADTKKGGTLTLENALEYQARLKAEYAVRLPQVDSKLRRLRESTMRYRDDLPNNAALNFYLFSTQVRHHQMHDNASVWAAYR